MYIPKIAMMMIIIIGIDITIICIYIVKVYTTPVVLTPHEYLLLYEVLKLHLYVILYSIVHQTLRRSYSRSICLNLYSPLDLILWLCMYVYILIKLLTKRHCGAVTRTTRSYPFVCSSVQCIISFI